MFAEVIEPASHIVCHVINEVNVLIGANGFSEGLSTDRDVLNECEDS